MVTTIQIVHSSRRTISLEMLPDGTLVVRAPRKTSDEYLNSLIAGKRSWIEKKRQYFRQIPAEAPPRSFTPAEIRSYKRYASRVIADRVRWYALTHEIKFNKIKVNNAKKRWGSCTSRGHLNFCWRLILMPPQVMDYVVVHELAHLQEMNHSRRFWQKVESILPDYRMHKKWLKDNQHRLSGARS